MALLKDKTRLVDKANQKIGIHTSSHTNMQGKSKSKPIMAKSVNDNSDLKHAS